MSNNSNVLSWKHNTPDELQLWLSLPVTTKMVQVPCQFSLQRDIQTLKNGLKCVANQKIFNVWSKSHMCSGCLFWKQWEKCTSLILQSIILNFGKHFWYVLNLITSCGNLITNFVKMSIWIISIVLNLLNFSKYFQL